jgi:hypothetical protein
MRLGLGLLLASLVLTGCGAGGSTPAQLTAGTVTTPTAVLVAAGDIACPPKYKVTRTQCQQAATAKLVAAQHPDRVLALGDLQYQNGTYADFVGSYAKSWGKLRALTYPVTGNHEYQTPKAAGYYKYFKGRQPGAPGYYRRSLNGWQIFVLNSNCGKIACAAQRTWLEKELTAHPSTCAIIADHHPRFSSGGEHGSSAFMRPFWAIAYRHHVDLALSGHDHDYERFAPMNPAGQLSNAGIRQFVSGGGGRSHYAKGKVVAGSQKFLSTPFGVLKLVLRPTSYSWQFLGIDGKVRDSGTSACH